MFKRLRFLGLVLACWAGVAGTAWAGDAEVGRVMAQPCIACHGEAGAKPIANYPIIAGQHKKYLLHALRSYKNGRRANAVMAGQVSGLSDADIANLAAYFAAQPSPLR